MKKILVVLITLLVFSGAAFAASSIVPSIESQSQSTRPDKWGDVLVIKLVCTAHTDGTFDSKTIAVSEIAKPANSTREYYQVGFRLVHAWAKTNATDDHTNAAVVTVTDATGQQLIGTTAGDTLSLSQTASTVTALSVDRASSQRAVTSLLTVAIADTGSTATVQDIYLVLMR